RLRPSGPRPGAGRARHGGQVARGVSGRACGAGHRLHEGRARARALSVRHAAARLGRRSPEAACLAGASVILRTALGVVLLASCTQGGVLPRAGDVLVAEAEWRIAPAAATSAAGYLELRHLGTLADTLVSVRPDAGV